MCAGNSSAMMLVTTLRHLQHARSAIATRASAGCAEVVEYACNLAPDLMGDYIENVSTGMDTYSIRQPLGVGPTSYSCTTSTYALLSFCATTGRCPYEAASLPAADGMTAASSLPVFV